MCQNPAEKFRLLYNEYKVVSIFLIKMTLPSIHILNLFSDWAFLVARISLAAIFVAHGWPKLVNFEQTAKNFSAMGFKPGKFWGPLVALLEFFGGLALALGLFVQPVALLFVGEFAVIIVWKIWRRQPLVGGWELDLVILGAALLLTTLGAGELSLAGFLNLY